MTNEEMRVAIAEACGWEAPTECTRNPPHNWRSPTDGCCYDKVPDYPNDLNAMHEAEKTITDEQWKDYRNHLVDLAWEAVKNVKPLPQWTRNQSCTAAQRAEAFLRTLGKWKDD